MNITVIGTGYVGLVTGACFAEMGNHVVCVDVDIKKVENLRNGILPIYEPGLDSVVINNQKAGRLEFTTSLPQAMAQSAVLFIAVGTPPGEDGSADLQYVLAVAKEIGKNMNQYCAVIDKSTVPVGTADKVRKCIESELQSRNTNIEFDVISNPEFLKEGAAVDDFMSPDRIIIGADSQRAKDIMAELYAPFVRSHPRLVYMRVRDAEMTKYAANAMLATKISFMNEIANLCESFDVDVESVRLGIGSDQRIGFHFIYPGAGYGGSCFPKDVKALVRMAENSGFDAKLLQAVEARNDVQKKILYEKFSNFFNGDLAGKKVAIWGLAFKPGTDDMREAPSIVLIEALIEAGVIVSAFDPLAMVTARREFAVDYFESGKLSFVESQYDAVKDVDALFLVTEWKLFRHPDFAKLKEAMKTPLIIDGRNQYDLKQISDFGFKYIGIGRAV